MILSMNQGHADIPLYLWESFIAVIEEGTLQKAADKLRTTQPTITRHLHQLEESLPLNLFELRGRTKSPTPFALKLHQKVKSRLQYLPDDINQSLQLFGRTENVAMTIGGPLEVLGGLKLSFAGKIQLSPIEKTKEALKNGTHDILVCDELLSSGTHNCKKLFSENYVFAVPKAFLKGKSNKDWRHLQSKYPMSAYSESLEFMTHFQNTASVNFVIPDWRSIECHVQEGLSWSIIPTRRVRKNPNYTTFPLALKGVKSSKDYYIYYRKDLASLGWFKKFLEQFLVSFK